MPIAKPEGVVSEGKYGWKLEGGTWVCKECGAQFSHPGPLNFHFADAHAGGAARPDPTPPEGNGAGRCPPHTWRRLSSSGAEAAAKHEGWSHVCSRCAELGVRLTAGQDILTEEELT